MTITDFSTLPLSDQLEILYTDGVHLSKRRADAQIVILYQFKRWYVEIFYEKYRQNPLHIRCSDSGEVLNPYLDQINIDDILNIN